jgi:hypothetical protein
MINDQHPLIQCHMTLSTNTIHSRCCAARVGTGGKALIIPDDPYEEDPADKSTLVSDHD